jgi:hypothetical protein
MLFNDMFLYAKPVKHRRTGDPRFIVYRALHRCYLQVSLFCFHDEMRPC